MTQPWQFVGYQKLANDTSTVQFNNILGTQNEGDVLSWKLVIEGLSTNVGAIRNAGQNEAFFYNNNTSNSNWDLSNYNQYDYNQTNNQTYGWGTNPQVGNGYYCALAGSNTWINPQGSSSNMQRYSTAEDSLQWSRFDVSYTKHQNVFPSMGMKAFNIVSTSSYQSYNNGCIQSSGSTNSTSSNNDIIAVCYGSNGNWRAGSKFWLWGLRTVNSF